MVVGLIKLNAISFTRPLIGNVVIHSKDIPGSLYSFLSLLTRCLTKLRELYVIFLSWMLWTSCWKNNISVYQRCVYNPSRMELLCKAIFLELFSQKALSQTFNKVLIPLLVYSVLTSEMETIDHFDKSDFSSLFLI